MPMDFDHSETGFPLNGAHAGVSDCMSCHGDLEFAKVGVACADCHTDVHRQEFGMDCQVCHTPESWNNQQDVFMQHAALGFPLTGVHASADCQSCHINQQQNEFAAVSTQCYTCHMTDYAQALEPDHREAQFDLDCQSCHTPNGYSWKGARFEHPETFPLRGAHIAKTSAN